MHSDCLEFVSFVVEIFFFFSICLSLSGGIQRDWVGVPRKLYLAGYDGYRCVCVRTTGPPSEHLESKEHNDKGDLDNPSLQEYKDCNPLFDWCLLKE